MLRFILRRLLWLVITVLGVSLVTFFLIFATPGDPARWLLPARLLEQNRDVDAAMERLRREYGLDRPIVVQYVEYLGNALRGDLGYSLYTRRPVAELLFQKLGYTAQLAGLIMLTATVVGIPLGMIAALKNGSLFDRSLIIVGSLLLSVPSFFFALLLVFVFAFQLRLVPTSGVGTLRHLILPVVSVATPLAISYAFLLRSNMLDAISTDYVRTARAKGLHTGVIAVRHMLPNAVLPLVTMISLDMAGLLTGIVLVEAVFNYPGIGLEVVTATNRKDIPVVMGSVFYGALMIGIGNLLADLLGAFLDPRVRLE
jgi:peptide/nickel transport system permease protein